jgi:hypothetical protein
MRFRIGAVALGLLIGLGLGGGAEAAVPKIQMLDRLAVSQGTAVVNLPKGTVSVKATLAPLPATIDTGTGTFEATIYKAYLLSSTDAAIEIPIGTLYPTSKSKASVSAALKGDVSHLGFDRVVVVAYSKDGLSSFDVLTGTLPQ